MYINAFTIRQMQTVNVADYTFCKLWLFMKRACCPDDIMSPNSKKLCNHNCLIPRRGQVWDTLTTTQKHILTQT